MFIQLTERQKEIIEIVKQNEPITSQDIAEKLGLTRAALRSDLSILTMADILDAKPRVGYYFQHEPGQVSKLAKIMDILVKDLQSHPVVVQENSSVYNAIVTLFLEDVGTIFVNDQNGYLLGVVSRKDLLKVTIGDLNIHQLPVSVVMSRMPNIVVTYPTEPFYVAAKKLVDYKVDALPVVEEEKIEKKLFYKVIGRFSKTNLANVIVSHLSEI